MSQIKVDTITDQAGTGAPSFSQGLTAAGKSIVSDSVQTDTITDEAGTGSPNFSQGLSVASGTALVAYVEGSYATTINNLVNTASPSSTTLNYQRIGNVVHIWGKFVLQISSSAAATSFDMTVPIAADNNFAADDVSGMILPDDTGEPATAFAVRESASTTVISARQWSSSAGTTAMYVNITYKINN